MKQIKAHGKLHADNINYKLQICRQKYQQFLRYDSMVLNRLLIMYNFFCQDNRTINILNKKWEGGSICKGQEDDEVEMFVLK